MTDGVDDDQHTPTAGNRANSVYVPETAQLGYDEAVSMQPMPDPSLGLGSTDLPLPEALKAVRVDDLLAGQESPSFDETFGSVLARRRSIREYKPLAAAALVGLLDQVFALRAWAGADDGGVRRFRPVPSAGARHPLVPLVLVENVNGLDGGLWRFDADGRQMLLVTTDASVLADSWNKVTAAGQFETRPPAVVVLGAQFDATLARYPSGSALVWRDTGVALGVLHLAATAAALGSCILGTAGVLSEDLLATCGLTGSLIGDVGSISIGGASRG